MKPGTNLSFSSVSSSTEDMNSQNLTGKRDKRWRKWQGILNKYLYEKKSWPFHNLDISKPGRRLACCPVWHSRTQYYKEKNTKWNRGLIQIEAAFVVLAMETGFYFKCLCISDEFHPTQNRNPIYFMPTINENATIFSWKQGKLDNGYKDPHPPCPTIPKGKKIPK